MRPRLRRCLVARRRQAQLSWAGPPAPSCALPHYHALRAWAIPNVVLALRRSADSAARRSAARPLRVFVKGGMWKVHKLQLKQLSPVVMLGAVSALSLAGHFHAVAWPRAAWSRSCATPPGFLSRPCGQSSRYGCIFSRDANLAGDTILLENIFEFAPLLSSDSSWHNSTVALYIHYAILCDSEKVRRRACRGRLDGLPRLLPARVRGSGTSMPRRGRRCLLLPDGTSYWPGAPPAPHFPFPSASPLRTQ